MAYKARFPALQKLTAAGWADFPRAPHPNPIPAQASPALSFC